MNEQEIAEHNAREQARYKFLILGVYPTGHGVTEQWIAPADVIATMATIRRNGAEPVIASVFKDGAPMESWPSPDFPDKVSRAEPPAIVAEPETPSPDISPAQPEFGLAADAGKGNE